MGMGGNRDYFSGINGNWNIVYDFPKPGMGMERSHGNERGWVHESHSRTSLLQGNRHRAESTLEMVL